MSLTNSWLISVCFPGITIPGSDNVPQRLVTLAIIQVFLSVLKFDNLNMVSMHYKLRLWCSSLYLMLSALRLTPLGIRRNGDTPLTPFLVFRTPGILFTGCPFPCLFPPLPRSGIRK